MKNQMSNIFISYSSEDRDSARRLAQAREQENAPGESIEPADTKIVRPPGTTTFFLKAQGADPQKKLMSRA